MGIIEFMRSTAGRLARIAAGIMVAIIGLVPIAAGVFNFCLLGPVLGVDLQGRPRSSH